MKNIDNPSQTKPYSEYGTILHKGLRYPDIYKNTGCFEFSFESFDLFVSFLYTKLKNNPNIKWPSASDRENLGLLREKVIDLIGQKISEGISKQTIHETIIESNYNDFIPFFESLDDELSTPSTQNNMNRLDLYYNQFRKLKQHPKEVKLGKTESGKYTKTSKKSISEYIDILKKFAKIAAIVAGVGITAYLWHDYSQKTTDEYLAELEDTGESKRQAFIDLINLLPEQNRVLRESPIQYFPSEDKEMSDANDNIKELYEQEGARGLLYRYMDLKKTASTRNLTDSEINELFALSYAINDAIPLAKCYEAIEDSAKADKNSMFDISKLDSISLDIEKKEADDVYSAFIIYTKKPTSGYNQFIIYDSQDLAISADKNRKKIAKLHEHSKNDPTTVQALFENTDNIVDLVTLEGKLRKSFLGLHAENGNIKFIKNPDECS